MIGVQMAEIESMGRAAAFLTVDLSAVVDNWKTLSRLAAPARCAAVVKADAYGLGAVPVVRALLRAGCREFFVALVEEGIRLRESLAEAWPADARIHLLHGSLPGAEADCLHHGLVPVLNSLDQLRRWQGLARQQGRALPAALQVDTGMARLGMAPQVLGRLLDEPGGLQGIAPSLVMSHLVSAEDPADPISARQLELFRPWRARVPAALGCLANSSGIFLGSDYHFDLVRPGAALFGVAPVLGLPNPMRQVARVRARLIQWREIGVGEAVGYNHTWRAERPTRLATVSVGYADGYLRSMSNHSDLRFHGMSVPLVGRVSMDTVTVDVTDVDEALLQPGALFDVMDEVQDVNALARQAGTNAYEILTSLGSRYKRHYIGDERI
ncbi:MAG: alanine racemase [Burkholderiales bacterium]